MIKIVFVIIAACLPIYAQISNDAGNRFRLAENYERAGEPEKAKRIYESLYKEEPLNYQYFEALNRAYIQLKQYDSSLAVIKYRMDKYPPDINIYGMLGKTYHLMGNESKAFEVWDEALKKLPPNPMNYRILANQAVERRAFDKAIELLEKGAAADGDPVVFYYELANLYSVTMRYREAAEKYCGILTRVPNQFNIVQSCILSYISKPDALPGTIEAFEACSGGGTPAKSLLARLYVENRQFDKAFDAYLEIESNSAGTGSEFFNFAQLLLSEGEYQQAAKVFRTIIDKYPDSPIAPSAKLGYAKTTESALRAARSNESWKTFYSIKPVSDDKINDVIKTYDQISSLYPNSDIAGESMLRAGRLLLEQQGDLQRAESYFKQAASAAPVSPNGAEASEYLGRINVMRGNLPSAAENFRSVIKNPRASEEKRNYANYQLARIAFYNKDLDKTKELLSRNLETLKDNTANDAIELSMLINTSMNDSLMLLQFAEAEKLASQQRFNEALEEYKKVGSAESGVMLKSLAELREAEMLIAMDSLETSAALLSKIAEESQNIYSDKALYLLGNIYQFGLDNPKEAVKIFEKLLAKYPYSLYLDEAREKIVFLRNNNS